MKENQNTALLPLTTKHQQQLIRVATGISRRNKPPWLGSDPPCHRRLLRQSFFPPLDSATLSAPMSDDFPAFTPTHFSAIAAAIGGGSSHASSSPPSVGRASQDGESVAHASPVVGTLWYSRGTEKTPQGVEPKTFHDMMPTALCTIPNV